MMATRSEKQLKNDAKLGRMAKKRAAAKRKEKREAIKKKAPKKRPAKKTTTKKPVKRKTNPVSKKPIQATQSARKKPTSRGAVIIGLTALVYKDYKSFIYYNGMPGGGANAWENSMGNAAVFSSAPQALKVARSLVKLLSPGVVLQVVSRNALPSHIEKELLKKGYQRHTKKKNNK